MRRIAVLAATLLALTVLATPAAAGQGSGNPKLSVSPGTASPDRVTEITVTGTDYLVPPHAPGIDVFGGVYVFFGWVADPGNFGPSIRNSHDNDGTFGVSYLYPGGGGDAETRDDGSGAIRLISFTTGGESGNATDFHMDDDGNWKTTIRIFGSTFTSTNPATGETTTTDCRQVQCGVFTIGAHGKASATNEKFAPVKFSAPATTTTSTPTAPTTTTSPTTAIGAGTATGATSPNQGISGSIAGNDEGTTTSTSPGSTSTTVPLVVAQEAPPTDEPKSMVPTDGQVTAIQLEVVSEQSTGNGLGLLVASLLVIGAGIGGVGLIRRRRRNGPVETAT